MATVLTPSSMGDQIVMLVGSVDGILRAFPGTNADGTPNSAARDAAVDGLVVGLWDAGLIPVFPGLDLTRVKILAASLVGLIETYKIATQRPTL